MNWKRQISLGNELSILTIISILIIITGIISKSFTVIMVGMLTITFILLNRLYLKHVGRKIEVAINTSEIKLFQGEDSSITISFHNTGKLPVVGGMIRITIDSIVETDRDQKRLETELIDVEIPLTILGKRIIDIDIPIHAKKRGIAKIRTLDFQIPHIFGFGEVYLSYNKPIKFEAIIYTSPKQVGGIERIIPRSQGAYPLKQSYFEDNSSVLGARDYNPTDPFNRIHWKAAARSNQLQTKIVEKTAQFSWTIMINARDKKLDEYLSGITYLLEYATLKQIPFEIFVNVRRAGKIPYIHYPVGVGRNHLQKTLELLARISKNSVTIPFHVMIQSIERHHTLSPFLIITGLIGANEQIITKSIGKRGITIFYLFENEQSIYLQKSFISNGGKDEYAV